MHVDKGKAIVGLIQCDVVGLVVDRVCDRQVSLILEVEGGGDGSRGGRGRAPPLLDESLVADIVDEALSITDEQGSHVGRRGRRECTAVLARD